MPTEGTPEEIAQSHRWHAIECNNLAWALAEKPDRSSDEDEEMMHAAHAAAYHWGQIGTELNQARAEMLLGRVHAILGNGWIAFRYAKQSYDYIAAHDPPDWEIAFAHAILAHASYEIHDPQLHQIHYAKAKELGLAIQDPANKEIFFTTIDLVPSPEDTPGG